MKISVLTTLYMSESYVNEFYQRITETILKITDDYEIVFVNDGSPDNTYSLVEKIVSMDDRVKLVDLSRNFGQHQATMIGLEYTIGEYVFLIDCDLEEAPENLSEFWKEMQSDENIDVVYGVQGKRRGKSFEKFSGHIFYSFFNYCSAVKIPRNLVTSRLMNKRYVESLRKYKERELVLAGIWYLAGFNQKMVVIKKGFKGKTTYSFFKKIEMMTNAIISFSDYPLMLIFKFGMLVTFLSLISLIYIMLGYLLSGHSIVGWRSLIVSIWFFGGITIMSLGIIGRYVGKIFIEVKQRPIAIVRQVLQRGA